MGYPEDALLQLSGLQHFAFCRRQWALIHIEKLWQENLRTTEGELMHKRVHESGLREKRGNVLTIRGLSVASRTLGISGQCDAVEFHRDPKGVSLQGEEGLWRPYPVEYKHGSSKTLYADSLQLCAQALCLEEMLCCPIEEGALFYGESKRRTKVLLDEELREKVRAMLLEMHRLYERGYTPQVKPSKACNACSLKEQCLPAILKTDSSTQYLRAALEEEEP